MLVMSHASGTSTARADRLSPASRHLTPAQGAGPRGLQACPPPRAGPTPRSRPSA